MILLPSFRQMKLLRYFFVLFSCLGITGLSHAQETSHPKAHKENHLDTFFTKVERIVLLEKAKKFFRNEIVKAHITTA